MLLLLFSPAISRFVAADSFRKVTTNQDDGFDATWIMRFAQSGEATSRSKSKVKQANRKKTSQELARTIADSTVSTQKLVEGRPTHASLRQDGTMPLLKCCIGEGAERCQASQIPLFPVFPVAGLASCPLL